MNLDELKEELRKSSNGARSEDAQRFFKTGKGQYGEGDVFLGLGSQQTRNVVRKFEDISFEDIGELLKSEIHEERSCALGILVKRYPKNKEKIFKFYLNNTAGINNWDLVDISAWKIIGDFLLDKPRDILYNLAKSDNLWERRIAIVATYAFIRKGEFDYTLKISEILFPDKHDLIHKAVGWMLREVGKKDQTVLEDFLKKHYSKIPRTTLRYAIERFPEEKRKKFLKGEF